MLIETQAQIETLAWDKMQQLIPAIVQDSFDGRVLMQAYMNPAALQQTLESGKVTFWSRSRQQLWTKGETSKHFLLFEAIHADCDNDCLLVLASPQGPSCHTGNDSCFDGGEKTRPQLAFLATLETLIKQRQQSLPEASYTTELFQAGVKRIAQKVGEEGVETALAAVAGDDEELQNEAADLLFHLLVLLQAKKLGLDQVIATLQSRA